MGEFGTGSNSEKWQHIVQFLQVGVSSFLTFKDIFVLVLIPFHIFHDICIKELTLMHISEVDILSISFGRGAKELSFCHKL